MDMQWLLFTFEPELEADRIVCEVVVADVSDAPVSEGKIVPGSLTCKSVDDLFSYMLLFLFTM